MSLILQHILFGYMIDVLLLVMQNKSLVCPFILQF